MDKVSDFVQSSAVLIAVLLGGSALVLVYILRLFKVEHDTEDNRKSKLLFYFYKNDNNRNLT